ncbi:hypothetical protein Tco_0743729 [Tanacetum coccineum]
MNQQFFIKELQAYGEWNRCFRAERIILDDLQHDVLMELMGEGAKLRSDEIEPTNEETSDLEKTNHDDEQEIDLVVHYCKPFNYKSGYSEWPTCSWKEDGYCNRGNLPGAYIVGNTLRYQDLEWYDALKDSELKDEALRNKAIMEGLIDEDDESSNNGWRRWEGYEIDDHDQEEREYENGHEDKERCELFDDNELDV